MLFDHFGLAQIVVHGDAGVVDEDIQSVDLADGPLDMLGVGDVQRQGLHPFIRMLKWAASSRITPLCSSFQRLFDECSTDVSVRAGNQDCLIFDVHTILLHDLCSSVCYYASLGGEDTSSQEQISLSCGSALPSGTCL